MKRRIRKTQLSIESKQKELESTNMTLKRTQREVIHVEKMAAVGQLAAGIAHEINNPLSFVSSNIRTIEKYCRTLSGFILECYNALLCHGGAERQQTLETVQRQYESKINYVLTDAKDVYKDLLDGCHRIEEIVSSLKLFARQDDPGFIDINVNECVELALKVVWNELKYKAQVQTELASLPTIYGHQGQISQVVANLLVNAAQAIEDSGNIMVSTAVWDHCVVLTVSDTGMGMDDATKTQIMEPFFTTKEPGLGTGRGLSILHTIVETHSGWVEVESTLGEGSTFRVFLPYEDSATPLTDRS
jgi:two-component system NtrC family sensor kinase